MSPRPIDTHTPNRTLPEPATVRACQQDRGSRQEQTVRENAALGQLKAARFHAKASAEDAGRCW